MALFDEGFKFGTAVAIGVGAMVLLPVVAPVVATIGTPLIKASLKGGMIIFRKGREAMSPDAVIPVNLALVARAAGRVELAQGS